MITATVEYKEALACFEGLSCPLDICGKSLYKNKFDKDLLSTAANNYFPAPIKVLVSDI